MNGFENFTESQSEYPNSKKKKYLNNNLVILKVKNKIWSSKSCLLFHHFSDYLKSSLEEGTLKFQDPLVLNDNLDFSYEIK